MDISVHHMVTAGCSELYHLGRTSSTSDSLGSFGILSSSCASSIFFGMSAQIHLQFLHQYLTAASFLVQATRIVYCWLTKSLGSLVTHLGICVHPLSLSWTLAPRFK